MSFSKRIKQGMAILALLIGGSMLSGQSDENNWQSYVNDPSPGNYLRCKYEVDQALKEYPEPYGSERNRVNSPVRFKILVPGVYGKFLELVSSGDALAVDLAFQIYEFVRVGHPQEEIGIAMESLVTRDPTLFLEICNRYYDDPVYNISDFRLGVFVVPKDYKYIDKFDLTIAESQKRIQLLMSVDIDRLETVKSICIGQLEKHIKLFSE
ncbi:hypothetical protein ACFL32_00590 [Candidatus Neomarinimicrobiota bacterium]